MKQDKKPKIEKELKNAPKNRRPSYEWSDELHQQLSDWRPKSTVTHSRAQIQAGRSSASLIYSLKVSILFPFSTKEPLLLSLGLFHQKLSQLFTKVILDLTEEL